MDCTKSDDSRLGSLETSILSPPFHEDLLLWRRGVCIISDEIEGLF